MNGETQTAQWYLDTRPAASTEQMSLDLARHLPRRLAISPVIVVTDRPAVLLAVVRKRWAVIIKEVTRQFASTLDRQKKLGLQREIEHMQRCHFTVESFAEYPTADCFFVGTDQLHHSLPPSYSTLYLTGLVSEMSLHTYLQNLSLNGLIVDYGDWLYGHEDAVHAVFMDRIKGVGA